MASEQKDLSWQADEYQDYQRSFGWYVGVAVVTVALTVGAFFLTDGDPLPAVAIVLMAVIFVGYALKPPGQQTYSVGGEGLKVGPKLYPFLRFQAFNVLKSDSQPRLHLVFNQRFIPPLTICLPPDSAQAKKVSRFLSEVVSYNPECQPHPIDRLMHYLRF